MWKMAGHKITIINIRKPIEQDVNIELQWLGNSLGLFGQRDKDRSCFRIFIELLKSTKHRDPISSDELAYRLRLTRGTVIHHINKLMESGLVIHQRNRYILRDGSLEHMMESVERDIERTFKELKGIAKDLDKNLGI